MFVTSDIFVFYFVSVFLAFRTRSNSLDFMMLICLPQKKKLKDTFEMYYKETNVNSMLFKQENSKDINNEGSCCR